MVVPLIAALSSCGSSDNGGSLLSKVRAAIGSETEPNANVATAQSIAGTQARLRGFIYPAGDGDFYKFTATAGDRVYIASMTADSTSSGDTVIDLLDQDGATLLEEDDEDGSLSGSSSSIAGAVIPGTGTYFIKVFGFSATSTQVRPYDLYFRSVSAPSTAEVEPNNTSATAQPFPASGDVAGSLSATTDVDFYSINLNAGDTIFASLDLHPARTGTATAGRLGIGLFANNILVVNDAGLVFDTHPSEAIFMTVKTAGTYVVFVDIGGGTAIGNYRLSASVFPRDQIGAVCTTYTSADVPKTIPTGPGQVTSVITVPGNPTVADLTVSLGITHAAPPDLDVLLTAPGGNTVSLFTDIGNAAFPNIDVTLDQSAGIPIGLFTVANNLVFEPKAASRLSWFNGQPAGGDWTLTVIDDLTANGGTLNNWSLQICEPAPATCPGNTPPTSITSFDFETGAGGFTHSGNLDSWAVGTPNNAPITNCNGGTGCWKTNLTGPYPNSSSQDLVSPTIDLTTATAPVRLSWAMKYQLETATFDHAWVEIQKSDGTNPTRLWEFKDGTLSDSVGNPATTLNEAAGWGVTTADVSAYAGQMVRLVFHMDADSSVNFAGLAIDDVSMSHCPAVCGNGAVEVGEECDDGANNGGPGSCCNSTCRFEAPTTICRPAANTCDLAETCTGASATCPADNLKPDGATCDDSNSCTQTDTCTAGVCNGGNPVQCNAADQCHVAGVCDPATGICSNPNAANGTSCDDADACTQTDTCQSGICTGANPVTCTASDQCHDPGTCDPATGVCDDPEAADGTTCNDADACTQTDTCQAGVCTGGNSVLCTASDACHVAGTCNPATGTCSNPNAADGTTCNDGDSCTRSDTCQSGTCTGANPVQCTAADQCHVAGTCNPATGTCSNPNAADGTTCSDGNGCTTADTCQAGTCASGAPVQCTASDACHVAGTCDPATGTCSNPNAADGTTCSDGDGCTQSDTCQSGTCTGANPVQCTASDACHVAGTCDPATGTCSNPAAADGTSCSDGNGCTTADTCQAGTCTAGAPVQCTASDACHVAGTCDPATGTCSNPAAADGTSCSDSNSCTRTDTCQAGVCTGANPVQCTASDTCHVAGICDPATGTCSNPVAADGTACNDSNACTTTDTCQAGTCTGGTAPSCDDGDACTADTCDPATGCKHDPVDSPTCKPGGGCGCTAPGGGEMMAFNLVGVLLMAVRRARRKR